MKEFEMAEVTGGCASRVCVCVDCFHLQQTQSIVDSTKEKVRFTQSVPV